MDAGLPGDDSGNKHYGFWFPFHGVTPAHVPGVLSLVALIIASLSIYRHHLQRTGRRTYAITAVIAFYSMFSRWSSSSFTGFLRLRPWPRPTRSHLSRCGQVQRLRQ